MSRPLGEYCGLECRAPGNTLSDVTRPVATSIVDNAGLPNVRFVKLVLVPRSDTKAMVLLSGDHVGCRSVNLSFVNRRTVDVFTSTRYRSLMPPDVPENAMKRPSGLHAGFVIAPTPSIRRSALSPSSIAAIDN